MTQRQLFLRHLAQTSDAPLALEIVRARGMFLYDRKGRAYMDLIAGIGVSALGHRHPKVEAAVRKQVGKYWHTMVYGEYVLSPQVKLAGLLAENLPGLDSTYFVNSGSEATEGAMKLAKRYTGRPEIVACRRAYHGSTQGAASLMSPTDFTFAVQPLLPGIRHIDFNSEDDLQKINRDTAAVIVETVQAEAGLILPRPEWLLALRARCNEVGALLILDEIQAGFGRTGELFAFSRYGIRPDILLLAKGFGGGMPIGAFVAPREIMRALSFKPVLGHLTTFGGHPVSAAAALATLEILLESDLLPQVPAKTALFQHLLSKLPACELRGTGLWFALDLGNFERMQALMTYCLSQGLITDWFLFNAQSLRICPPLVISEAEIEWACGVLAAGLDKIG